mgnify:CR=1 FL=1
MTARPSALFERHYDRFQRFFLRRGHKPLHGSRPHFLREIIVKELRLKNSLTQEELADRCELTKGYISQLENDLTSPSITTLKDILTALGCSLSEFFSGFDEQEPLSYGENDYFTVFSAFF